ncbi:MAG: DUF4199 domain-containing protein [Prevotella sp.]|nr:DUF4199 domain-containing protein [Prevotella sp.]
MLNSQSITQTNAYARQDGFWLGLLWIASFACIVYAPESGLGLLLMMATPFMIVWRMGAFRKEALAGAMSYRRAFAYSFYSFFYASLVFAAAQMVYFRYLDGGRFMSFMIQSTSVLKQVYEQNGMPTADFDETLKLMGEMKPFDTACLFLMQNMTIGFLASVVIALFGRKGSPRQVQP